MSQQAAVFTRAAVVMPGVMGVRQHDHRAPRALIEQPRAIVQNFRTISTPAITSAMPASRPADT
jgi:hypothetical protein